MDAERYSAQLEGESHLAPLATVSRASCQQSCTNVPLLLVWAAARDHSKVGGIRTVCGHAADHSDPSGDRQGEQERYISEFMLFAQFTPEPSPPPPLTE